MKIVNLSFITCFFLFCLSSCRVIDKPSLYSDEKELLQKHQKVAILPVLANCDCSSKEQMQSQRKLYKAYRYQVLLYNHLQKDTLQWRVKFQPITQTNAILDSLQLDFRKVHCDLAELKGSDSSYMQKLTKVLGVDAILVTSTENRSLGLVAIPFIIIAAFYTDGGNGDLIRPTYLDAGIYDKNGVKIWTCSIGNYVAILPPVALRSYFRKLKRRLPYKK